MSDTAPVKKKSGKKKILLIALGAVIVGGGGVGAGLWASGYGGHAAEPHPDLPKLVVRDGIPASETERWSSPDGDKAPDPTKFVATYYPIKESFTANLRDSDSFVQVALGVSTYYDQRVIDNITKHEMAVRSAVLMTLANQDSGPVTTPEGKAALQGELRKAINETLKAKEGFGGINDVYFTNFVVQ